MKKVEIWYYPRVLENPDPLESEGETKIDYNQLIKTGLYFEDNATIEDIENDIYTLKNSGVISIDKVFIDE